MGSYEQLASYRAAETGRMSRPSSFQDLLSSARGRALMRIGVFALGVALERWSIARSSRRARHLDARTGGAPTLRQTILLLGTGEAIKWALDRTMPKPDAQRRQAAGDLQRELKRVRAEHPGDRDARREAIARVHRERGADGGRDAVRAFVVPMALRVAVGVTINRGPIPFLRERRTLADLLAGTKLAPRESPRRVRLLRRGRAS